MGIRRVATGHDERGRAVVASDDMVEDITVSLTPGWRWHNLWGSDASSAFPDDGRRPQTPLYFPPLEGYRFCLFTVPPDAEGVAPADLDVEAAIVEFQAKLPGLAEYLEPDDPGMHTTASVDVGVVLSGEATLELDDGVTVTLRAGDTYVQNGTRHRWSNRGSTPAVIAATLIGAHHQRVV